MNDCSQTTILLMLGADGELGAEQAAWLALHVESCPACRLEQMRFLKLDEDSRAYGELVIAQNPRSPVPVISTAPQIAAPQASFRAAVRWLPKMAAVLAALLLLGALLFHRSTPEVSTSAIDDSFVPIPYVQPLDPYESATVMRMDVSVATLIAVGYKVDTTDPAAVVKADVLVGEDGRAHAVRLLSNLLPN